jgi:hypothetical protein
MFRFVSIKIVFFLHHLASHSIVLKATGGIPRQSKEQEVESKNTSRHGPYASKWTEEEMK